MTALLIAAAVALIALAARRAALQPQMRTVPVRARHPRHR